MAKRILTVLGLTVAMSACAQTPQEQQSLQDLSRMGFGIYQGTPLAAYGPTVQGRQRPQVSTYVDNRGRQWAVIPGHKPTPGYPMQPYHIQEYGPRGGFSGRGVLGQ